MVAAVSLAVAMPIAVGAEFQFPAGGENGGTQMLTVPDGFSVERVAGPPLVDRPIVAGFDVDGHLYVADSSGSNAPVEEQRETRPHRIVRLSDTDGDGFFDRSVVFADRLMFPEGILVDRGVVYCAAPPEIWKLEDTDGDGVADRREVWFDGVTLTGCANDLHGPYRGPDGWIYWCKGGFAEQEHTYADGSTSRDRAARIFRMRRDGSGFGQVIAGGMDNPVDVVFTPTGDPVFTTTFYEHPGNGRRDALVHAVFGGVYPKRHGVTDGILRTGEFLPALAHLGPAAPAGLTDYQSGAGGFGDEFRGNLFSAQFNLRTVGRHVLERDGATYRSTDSAFLVSDHPEFHPTDVIEDADGSLLVLDTGGWYKLCCPTSQIARPETLGAIYRVRRDGAHARGNPRGRDIDWAGMAPPAAAALLGDRRPAVVGRATDLLVAAGDAAVPALAAALADPETGAAFRLRAVWALCDLGSERAVAELRVALGDPDPGVAQAAARAVGVHRDRLAVGALTELLSSPSVHTVRAAAEALASIADPDAVPALLDVAPGPADRVLEHAVVYALARCGDAGALRGALAAGAGGPHRLRAAAIALGPSVQGREIELLLDSGDPLLAETARWITAQHPEHAAAVAGVWAEHAEALANLLHDPAVQRAAAAALTSAGTQPGTRAAVLRALAGARPDQLAPELAEALAENLTSADAVAAARGHTALAGALRAAALDPELPVALRVAAFEVPDRELADDEFTFLLETVSEPGATLDRAAAADRLAASELGVAQRLALARVAGSLGATVFPRVLPVFDGEVVPDVVDALVGSVVGHRAVDAVTSAPVSGWVASLPAGLEVHARPLAELARSAAGGGDRAARLEELESQLGAGDPKRGQIVFNSARSACATCHTAGYLGVPFGPDLTKIGSVRTRRDLLEAIVFPSASFVRGFEPSVVTAADGSVHFGMVRESSTDAIAVESAPAQAVSLARSDIASIDPSPVSLMPAGLDQVLTPGELSDLLAFLESRR